MSTPEKEPDFSTETTTPISSVKEQESSEETLVPADTIDPDQNEDSVTSKNFDAIKEETGLSEETKQASHSPSIEDAKTVQESEERENSNEERKSQDLETTSEDISSVPSADCMSGTERNEMESEDSKKEAKDKESTKEVDVFGALQTQNVKEEKMEDKNLEEAPLTALETPVVPSSDETENNVNEAENQVQSKAQDKEVKTELSIGDEGSGDVSIHLAQADNTDTEENEEEKLSHHQEQGKSQETRSSLQLEQEKQSTPMLKELKQEEKGRKEIEVKPSVSRSSEKRKGKKPEKLTLKVESGSGRSKSVEPNPIPVTFSALEDSVSAIFLRVVSEVGEEKTPSVSGVQDESLAKSRSKRKKKDPSKSTKPPADSKRTPDTLVEKPLSSGRSSVPVPVSAATRGSSTRRESIPSTSNTTNTPHIPTRRSSTASVSSATDSQETAQSEKKIKGKSPSQKKSGEKTVEGVSTSTPKQATPRPKPTKRDVCGTDLNPALFPSDKGLTFHKGEICQATDVHGDWYLAKIKGINVELGKVWIHYNGWNSRYDCWVDASSPGIKGPDEKHVKIQAESMSKKESEELKVGDYVMAKWPGTVPYLPATVLSVEEVGYNLLFYDGFERITRRNAIKNMTPEQRADVDEKKFGQKLILMKENPNELYDPDIASKLSGKRRSNLRESTEGEKAEEGGKVEGEEKSEGGEDESVLEVEKKSLLDPLPKLVRKPAVRTPFSKTPIQKSEENDTDKESGSTEVSTSESSACLKEEEAKTSEPIQESNKASSTPTSKAEKQTKLTPKAATSPTKEVPIECSDERTSTSPVKAGDKLDAVEKEPSKKSRAAQLAQNLTKKSKNSLASAVLKKSKKVEGNKTVDLPSLEPVGLAGRTKRKASERFSVNELLQKRQRKKEC